MSEQLSLLGLDATIAPFKLDAIPDRGGKLRGYNLFLAIFPEPVDAYRFARAAVDLRSQHELDGELLAPERLHITLREIPKFSDTTPQAVVDAAIAASASVVCPPVHIVFDRVLSFSGNNAFVLRCKPGSDAGIARLRQSLAVALLRNGPHPNPSRTPHMTMLYDPHHITQHAIELISWTATRFALIVSHAGLSHHQWGRRVDIGRSALTSRTVPFRIGGNAERRSSLQRPTGSAGTPE